MQYASTDIVIAGGSYVGLTLALAFAREFGPEVRILLVDRAAPGSGAAAADPRASAISAASRNLLSAIGIWRQLEDEAVAVSEIELTDTALTAGVRRGLLTYDNIADSGNPASWIVPNGVLGSALARAVAEEPSIRLLHGVSVTGLDAGSAAAAVSLSNDEQIATQLVVAADGKKSAVRDMAGIRTLRWDHWQTGIVTAITHELNHHNRAIQHFLPGGPFAMLPLKGGFRSCVTWSEQAGEAERILALDNDTFLEEVDQRVAGRLGAVALDGSRKSWELETHIARAFHAPRLALTGDAAHGVHPIAGQGLNLGLRDVAALVECVSDAVAVGLSPGDASALQRYSRWRRFDTTVSTAAFSGLNRLFANDWPLARSAREVGLGVLDRMPGIKQMFVTEAAGLSGDLPKLLRNPVNS